MARGVISSVSCDSRGPAGRCGAGRPSRTPAPSACCCTAAGAARRTCSTLAERIGDPTTSRTSLPRPSDNSWWPGSFLAPIAENEPWLSSALGVVDALLHVARRSLADRARRVLAGRLPGGGVRAAPSRALRRAAASTPAGSAGRGAIPPRLGSFDGTPAYLGTSRPGRLGAGLAGAGDVHALRRSARPSRSTSSRAWTTSSTTRRSRRGGRCSAVVVDGLDVVAVGVEHERAVVAGVVDGALAGRAVVAVAGRGRRGVEGVDGRVVLAPNAMWTCSVGGSPVDERERAAVACELDVVGRVRADLEARRTGAIVA